MSGETKYPGVAGIGRRNQEQVSLRLPDGMRSRIESRAAANGRSMNTELVMIINAALSGAAREDERLTRIEAKLDKLLAS
jgi:plasmid stability protein